MSLTIALSKGKLLPGAEALFRRAGLPFPEDPGRRHNLQLQTDEEDRARLEYQHRRRELLVLVTYT